MSHKINLIDLVNYKKGFAFKSSDLNEGAGIPVVKLSNTNGNRINIKSCQRVSIEKANDLQSYRLLKDDVIIATVGSWPSNPESVVGKIIKVDEHSEGSLLNQNAVVLRTNNKLNQHYLYYLLCNKDFKDYIVNTAQGSANQASITLKDIFSYNFNLPPFQEQQAIAEVLSSLDDKIDLLHRNNKTLEEMAETLFRQWFVEGAKEEWEVKRLDEILTTVGGTTPSTSNPDFWNGDISWTSPKDITTLKGIYLFETERKITASGLKKVSSGLLPEGTLLMSSRAPVGVLAFAEISLCINQGYIAILDNKGYNKLFIYLWLKHNMELVHSYSNGSTFMEISKTAFKSLEITLPPVGIVNEFCQSITPMFDKIRHNEKSVKQLMRTRDSLLPKLMSGQVTVNINS